MPKYCVAFECRENYAGEHSPSQFSKKNEEERNIGAMRNERGTLLNRK